MCGPVVGSKLDPNPYAGMRGNKAIPVLHHGVSQEFFIGRQQFLTGQAQVEWDVSNSTTSCKITEITSHDKVFDHQSSGVASRQRKNLNEERSANVKNRYC